MPTTRCACSCKARRLAAFFASHIFLFAAVSVPLRAQTKSLSPEQRASIEKSISSFMAANSVPGISAAVVQDGDLAWSEGFAMADLENFVPATPLTVFRLGSISKPITATAILQLSERGKVDLDAEVQKLWDQGRSL